MKAQGACHALMALALFSQQIAGHMAAQLVELGLDAPASLCVGHARHDPDLGSRPDLLGEVPAERRLEVLVAGGDEEATAHLREILAHHGLPPSSPSMALFKDGKPVYMLHRGDIERRDPMQIAALLNAAFDENC